jgi:hypothetical protein
MERMTDSIYPTGSVPVGDDDPSYLSRSATYDLHSTYLGRTGVDMVLSGTRSFM